MGEPGGAKVSIYPPGVRSARSQASQESGRPGVGGHSGVGPVRSQASGPTISLCVIRAAGHFCEVSARLVLIVIVFILVTVIVIVIVIVKNRF